MGPVIYTKSNPNRGFTQSVGFLRKRVDFFDNYECSGRIFRLDGLERGFVKEQLSFVKITAHNVYLLISMTNTTFHRQLATQTS